jgi:hypothetical protein
MTTSDLIITTSIGYSEKLVLPFFKSLENIFFGEVLVLCNKRLNIKGNTYKITFLDLANLSKTIFNSPNNQRYLWIREFLTKTKNSYEYILLTDIRDVYFQNNPFEFVHEKLIVAEENKLIANCQYNSEWIISLYGQDYYETINNSQIFCSGTILGNFNQILQLLDYIVSHLNEFGKKLDTGENTMILDQGIFNHFCQNHLNSIEIHNYKTGKILTAGYIALFHISKDLDILNDRNEIFNIVHQYDRYQFLTDLINKKLNIQYPIENLKKDFKNLLKNIIRNGNY